MPFKTLGCSWEESSQEFSNWGGARGLYSVWCPEENPTRLKYQELFLPGKTQKQKAPKAWDTAQGDHFPTYFPLGYTVSRGTINLHPSFSWSGCYDLHFIIHLLDTGSCKQVYLQCLAIRHGWVIIPSFFIFTPHILFSPKPLTREDLPWFTTKSCCSCTVGCNCGSDFIPAWEISCAVDAAKTNKQTK